jgi:hypothetical protein
MRTIVLAICIALSAVAALAQDRPAADKGKPALTIAVDTTETPDMAAWAARAKELCEKNYAMICEQLGEDGFHPPTKFSIVFKVGRGIAATSGRTITCRKGWFTAHPDDYGAVIHETCHVVQGYRRAQPPSWVTEGIADYVRWFVYEPAERRPHVDPRRARYTDSYQTTAAFFDWIVRAKDKTFVKRLNAACRRGEYKEELFQTYAGKPVGELWQEFIASLQGKPGKR